MTSRLADMVFPSGTTGPSATEHMSLVVILPAANEERYLGPCLASLYEQRAAPPLHVIVSANGCTDGTVAIARDHIAAFAARGHVLVCLDHPWPDKIAALNRAEAAIPPALVNASRLYLDADVTCDPDLCAQLASALATDEPAYATGKLVVTRSSSVVTRLYAAVWEQTPFGRSSALGAGLFAVNAAGRHRWQMFPPAISDDTFVRWCFAPSERVEVPAKFHWPMVSGLTDLIRVRGRQDHLVQQVRTTFPELEQNEDVPRPSWATLFPLALRQPVKFCVYYAICVAARLLCNTGKWARGRQVTE